MLHNQLVERSPKLPHLHVYLHVQDLTLSLRISTLYTGFALQYRSSFQSSNLIGRAVTRSQTSLGVKARFRLEFRAGYDDFECTLYGILISTNQIRALI